MPSFGEVYKADQWAAYEKRLDTGQAAWRPGGGSKGKLPEVEDKLLFTLYSYKTYPTFDALGSQFDLARSKACTNLHKLSPILHETLVQLGMMPQRELESPEALQALLGDVSQIIIDATERQVQRSQDEAEQRAHYSGKKKAHGEKHDYL